MPPKKPITKPATTSKTPTKTNVAPKGTTKTSTPTSKKTPTTTATKSPATTEKTAIEKKEEPKAPEAPVVENIKIKELTGIINPDDEQGWCKSGKWPCLLDPSNTAGTFLRYRNTNYLQAVDHRDMEAERIRLALLGGIRFGKPLVIDMGGIDRFDLVAECVNKVQSGLMDKILDKRILQEDEYTSLIREGDDEEYTVNKFSIEFIKNFAFVLIMSGESRAPPPGTEDKMYYLLVE